MARKPLNLARLLRPIAAAAAVMANDCAVQGCSFWPFGRSAQPAGKAQPAGRSKTAGKAQVAAASQPQRSTEQVRPSHPTPPELAAAHPATTPRSDKSGPTSRSDGRGPEALASLPSPAPSAAIIRREESAPVPPP